MILYALLARNGVSVPSNNYATKHLEAKRIYGNNNSHIEAQLEMGKANEDERFIKLLWKEHRCREIIKGRLNNEILPAVNFKFRARNMGILKDTHYVYGAMISFGISSYIRALSEDDRDKLFTVLTSAMNNGRSMRRDITVIENNGLINIVIKADKYGGNVDVGMIASFLVGVIRDGQSTLLLKIISLYDEYNVEKYYRYSDDYTANYRRELTRSLARLFIERAIEFDYADSMWTAMAIASHITPKLCVAYNGPVSSARGMAPYMILSFLRIFKDDIAKYFSEDRSVKFGFLYNMWILGKLTKEF